MSSHKVKECHYNIKYNIISAINYCYADQVSWVKFILLWFSIHSIKVVYLEFICRTYRFKIVRV